MRIEHIALWTADLERSRDFYTLHFNATASMLYRNSKTGFSSYFLSFSDGARLEIMARPDVTQRASTAQLGFAHFAVSLGSEEEVVRQTAALAAAGISVVSEPRRTGDGYFESVIMDPDGNLIELTV